MRERKAPATKGLLVAIGIVFALQNLWGLDNETAYAMGALHEPSVDSGQWWRLISAGFLHGNLAHAGMNGFALVLIGGQLEKVLGAPRYLIIYTASLIGGSFASMMLLTPEMISLGASGAIWGLLGAQTALAFGRPKILPESVARSMKPMVMQNLLINVGISFIGGIDWAAHFGGGLAGGLLLASGVFYLSPDREGRAPGWITGLAKGCVALMAIGVGVALYVGQPWQFQQEVAELMAVPPAH
jgi:rhomboid protease GluP